MATPFGSGYTKRAGTIPASSTLPDSAGLTIPAGKVRAAASAAKRAIPVGTKLSCIRYREVLLLQGTPLMGVIFSVGRITTAEIPALALFSLAGFLLVAHIWSFNDWADVRVDADDPGKAQRIFLNKGVALSGMLGLSLTLLAASLVAFAFLPTRTLAIAGAIAALGFVYSSPLIKTKSIPLLSSVTHLVGGTLHFLLGYSLFAHIGRDALLIAPFFALVFTAGHAVQEVRDVAGDRRHGIATNAVVFGARRTFVCALLGLFLAHAYLIFLAVQGIVPLRLSVASLAIFPQYFVLGFKTLRGSLGWGQIDLFRCAYRKGFFILGLFMVSVLFF